MTLPSQLTVASMNHSLLLMEPDEQKRRSLAESLGPAFSVQCFEQAAQVVTASRGAQRPDLILFSWNSPESSLSALKEMLDARTGVPVVLLCATDHISDMAFAIKFGAAGFLHMPMDDEAMITAIQARLNRHSIATQKDDGHHEETPLGDGLSFVRCGRRMRLIGSETSLVAKSNIPVLILGESGTGKEVLARYIHAMSDRSDSIFMKVNCAAMPAELLESELYGHERGAFTGAIKSNPGKFELCDGGTLFLDEIGEMSAPLQAKLLHVLQDGAYYRLGGRTAVRSNVRIIAATNIDVKSAIAHKIFRKDLYYRLSGFSVQIPPLRERREEIASFADHFMQKAALKHQRRPLPISDTMLEAFRRYDWPGNLRELENVVNRYLVMGNAQSIVNELGLHVVHTRNSSHVAGLSEGVGLKEYLEQLNQGAESAVIARILDETRWNRRAAANRLRISYTSLLHKIKRYELAPDAPAGSQENRRPVIRAQHAAGPSLSVVGGSNGAV